MTSVIESFKGWMKTNEKERGKLQWRQLQNVKNKSAKITNPFIDQAGPFFGALILLFRRSHFSTKDELIVSKILLIFFVG